MASSDPPPARSAIQPSQARPVTAAGHRRFNELFLSTMVEHFDDLLSELTALGRLGLQMDDLVLVLFDPLSAGSPRIAQRQDLLANHPEVTQPLAATMNEAVVDADDLCVVVYLVEDCDLLVRSVPWTLMSEADALMTSTNVRPLPTAEARSAWVSWVMRAVGSTLPPGPE